MIINKFFIILQQVQILHRLSFSVFLKNIDYHSMAKLGVIVGIRGLEIAKKKSEEVLNTFFMPN